nr:uncharacterized protein LOC129425744 [Misgurnus anguillicaudatus]
MENLWAKRSERLERKNMRKRAVRRVDRMFESFEKEINPLPEKRPNTDAEDVCSSVETVYECEEEISSEDSNDSDSNESFSCNDLASSLSGWAVKFGVSLVALTALLSILKVHHPFLPKDGRSLLQTTKRYLVDKVAGGTYHYFGILKSLGKTLENLSLKVPDRHVFRLQLNIDGLPLFKSSSLQFWPVLGMLQDCVDKKPFLIALFCGVKKPNPVSDYLDALVKEINSLTQGFVINGKSFWLKITSVICDAPARAFVKCIKTHTGYSGCDKCVQSGVYSNHRMTFPEICAFPRTDESFKLALDEDHHTGHSPLTNTNIGMVSCFPHDYMHLVCLGVVRRLLDLWMTSTGPLPCRLSGHHVKTISERLTNLRVFVPVEFARKPRSLEERLRWKATEFRQFLLYTGPVVLKRFLSEQVYNNFMLLSAAICILANPTFCLTMNEFAKTLLVSFVEHFSKLYGSDFVVYNIHGLIHLSDDVGLHGHLDLISGFPF